MIFLIAFITLLPFADILSPLLRSASIIADAMSADYGFITPPMSFRHY